MDGALILLVAALMIYETPGVRGSSHLSFSNTPVDISRSGCGVSKLCVALPDNCDPTGSSSCLFASFNTSSPMPPDGVDLDVQLRGDSDGFIALGLTAPQNTEYTMVFICARNVTPPFSTMNLNNSDQGLRPSERMVRDIRVSENGNVIQCEFTIPKLNATSTRSSHVTTFKVQVASGTFNASTGSIDTLTFTLNSGNLNLADPTAPTTLPTVTGNNNMTTAGSGTVQPQAVPLLVLMSVLTGSLLLKT